MKERGLGKRFNIKKYEVLLITQLSPSVTNKGKIYQIIRLYFFKTAKNYAE